MELNYQSISCTQKHPQILNSHIKKKSNLMFFNNNLFTIYKKLFFVVIHIKSKLTILNIYLDFTFKTLQINNLISLLNYL